MKTFISNTGNTITTNHLFSLFLSYGVALAANAPKDIKGHSRGFGYVIMPNNFDTRTTYNFLIKHRSWGRTYQ